MGCYDPLPKYLEKLRKKQILTQLEAWQMHQLMLAGEMTGRSLLHAPTSMQPAVEKMSLYQMWAPPRLM
jgi:hypothetical protein